jgi:hypothetical protein
MPTPTVDPDLLLWYETVDDCLDAYLGEIRRRGGPISPADRDLYFAAAVVPPRPRQAQPRAVQA